MKSSLTVLLFTLASTLLSAQVEIDKPIQLTGSGSDAKISGIQEVGAPTDAVSAQVLQNCGVSYAPATNAGNTYSVSLTPVPAYTSGLLVHFKASADNTGAASLNVNGLGDRAIKKNYNVDLVANDIRNGQMVTVIYDGSLFQMLSQTGNTQGATTTACTIGATGPGGGKIFYCGPPYNMESSTTDQNTGTATFGCSGIYISSFFELGTGMGNTANIAASCATAGIAAKICDVLVLGGKSDWFLPSKDELDLMYQYRTTIGNFSTSGIADYWSSSRNDLSNAWVRDFSNGAEGAEAKSSTNNRVRCIRSFQ